MQKVRGENLTINFNAKDTSFAKQIDQVLAEARATQTTREETNGMLLKDTLAKSNKTQKVEFTDMKSSQIKQSSKRRTEGNSSNERLFTFFKQEQTETGEIPNLRNVKKQYSVPHEDTIGEIITGNQTLENSSTPAKRHILKNRNDEEAVVHSKSSTWYSSFFCCKAAVDVNSKAALPKKKTKYDL